PRGDANGWASCASTIAATDPGETAWWLSTGARAPHPQISKAVGAPVDAAIGTSSAPTRSSDPSLAQKGSHGCHGRSSMRFESHSQSQYVPCTSGPLAVTKVG